MAPDPTSKTILPIDYIEKAIKAKSLNRSLYRRVSALWRAWQADTAQPRESISLSPGEVEALDFIDYQLSDEQKVACTQWAEELGAGILDLPDEVVRAGYRITFTHDEKNGCVVVTVLGRAVSNPNYNKAMTTRHSDIRRALEMALFKQIVVFEYESWGPTDVENMFG